MSKPAYRCTIILRPDHDKPMTDTHIQALLDGFRVTYPTEKRWLTITAVEKIEPIEWKPVDDSEGTND